MRLLVYCTEASGGIADYAHVQAEALAQAYVDVTLIAPADYIHQSILYQLRPLLPSTTAFKTLHPILRRLFFAWRLLANAHRLDQFIRRSRHRAVLWSSFTEYLAPLWAWRFRRLQSSGVVFSAVVHDPVRSFCVGPLWWHRFSIAEGFSFLSHTFVHAPIQLDTVRSYPLIRTTVIPHGPFPFPPSPSTRSQLKAELGISIDTPLLLAFGRLRTDKNLERVLHALASHPTAHLLVAGPEATSGQLQSFDYQRLAHSLSIADRCHWRVHFLSAIEVAAAFTVADAVVLAYSASFRSASGVLNVVANYRLPILASAGDSALAYAVENYNLGVLVPPDNTSALAQGLKHLLDQHICADWSAYLRDHSWDKNARLVIEALGLEVAHG